MSWKNLASVAVCALLASPAWAQPTLTITGGRQNGANRVWNVAVTPDDSLFNVSCAICDPANTLGGALALELGLRATGGNILSVSAANNATRIEQPANPGNVVFGWETLTTLDDGDFPVGIQVGTAADANEAFAALGGTFFTNGNNQDILTVVTQASVTSLAFGGRYNADGSMAAVDAFVNARVAQDLTNFDAGNSGSVVPLATRFTGDMNGDGLANFGDLNSVVSALTTAAVYEAAFPHLNRIDRGDASGDGLLNFGDLNSLVTVYTAGGSGSATAVPEPSSIALVMIMCCLGGFAYCRRYRN